MDSPALRLTPMYSRTSMEKKAEEVSPLLVDPCSFWACKRCDKQHHFDDLSAVRPLGRVQCSACGNVPQSSDDLTALISGFSLDRIDGTSFKISLPPGHIGLPRTAFVNICCQCGRSHHRSPKPSPPKPLETPKAKLRVRVWNAYQGFKGRAEGKPEINRISLPMEFDPTRSTPTPNNELVERTSFTVHFKKQCTCRHVTCENCLKFKVAAGGEWVARSFDLPAN